jgi:hypothetical protein
MQAHKLAFTFVGLLTASACAPPSAGDSSSADNLGAIDLPTKPPETWMFGDDHVLDRAFLQGTSELPDDSFAAKWTSSLSDPVLFMRSYPAGYHKDLVSVRSTSAIQGQGPEGLCLGDAHPDNFGFLQIEGQTVYSFNDLDDSGYCPIGYDAARYFSVLRLYFKDDQLTLDAINQYVATVQDLSHFAPIDPSVTPTVASNSTGAPTWASILKKGLTKLTADGTTFAYGTNSDTQTLSPASDTDQMAIKAALQSTPLAQSTVLDIASVMRDYGGSGGLRRYLLLLDNAPGRQIIELKEFATPGTEFGSHTQTLAPEMRLQTLKRSFWSAANPDSDGDYYYIDLLGGRFLVRNKYTKKSLDVADANGKAYHDRIMTQVSEMARIHRLGWNQVQRDPKALALWLWEASYNLANLRWQPAWNAASSAH